MECWCLNVEVSLVIGAWGLVLTRLAARESRPFPKNRGANPHQRGAFFDCDGETHRYLASRICNSNPLERCGLGFLPQSEMYREAVSRR